MSQIVDMKERLLDLSLKTITEFLLGQDANGGESTAAATNSGKYFATEFDEALTWISKRE